MLRFVFCLSALFLMISPAYSQGVYSTLEEALNAAETEVNGQPEQVMVIGVPTAESAVPTNEEDSEDDEGEDSEEDDEDDETEAEESAAEPVEEVIEVKVFSPKFMEALNKCEAIKEIEEENEVEIIGLKDGRCQLKYMDFDLSVPMNILGNIHNFDDLKTLLKNQDIAHYNYQPTYTYDGLMYAVMACAKKTNYFGVGERSLRHGKEVKRGLTAEYADKECVIKLQNDVIQDGKTEDYSVICRLSDDVLDSLEPYFEELTEKYGGRREFVYGKAKVLPPKHNQETHEADMTLMYFMQQNGYCVKNHQ